jgi:hypothetical protein
MFDVVKLVVFIFNVQMVLLAQLLVMDSRFFYGLKPETVVGSDKNQCNVPEISNLSNGLHSAGALLGV